MIFLGFAAAVSAQSLAEANEAYAAGDYADAIPGLKAAVAAKPRDTALQHKLGIAYLRTGDYESALEHLGKGTNESKIARAEIAFMQYRFDNAEELLDSYESTFNKGRKNKVDPEAETVEALRGRIDAARSMLDRVEKIVIVDSIAVDREDFLRAFRLSTQAGTLGGQSALPGGMQAAVPAVVYTTPDGNRKIWSAPDENENYRLVESYRLTDGSWESPAALGDLGEGGDANYPFLMPDGVTLYFANDGENSLGGYDIFLSRNNGDEFLQPQNVGMPYNSPYDDYMLVIDEATGAGWWATDRNRLGDEITIYRFIPKDLRVNYPVDEPRLAELALVTSIAATQEPGVDYSESARRIEEGRKPVVRQSIPAIRLALPDGRIIDTPSALHSAAARQMMGRYVEACKALATGSERLAKLRREYASNRSLAPRVAQAEAEEANLQAEVARLRDAVIAAEI